MVLLRAYIVALRYSPVFFELSKPAQQQFTALKGESGAIFAYITVIVAALLSIAALLIDNSRHEISVQTVQSSVDAAALAGVRYLDGSAAGWRNSKRAAFSAFRSNNSFGSAEAASRTLTLTNGSPDPLDAGTQFEFTEGTANNLRVRIERGFYVFEEHPPPGERPGYHFQSLEIPPPGTVPTTAAAESVPVTSALPDILAANAVRVTATLTDLPLTFARLFGTETLGEFERVSIAITEAPREECVSPIAIPACALMLDTRRASLLKYDTDAYHPEMQCQREIIAAEANYEVTARMDGVARSDSYPRLPYLDPAELEPGEPAKLNTKAIPIRAVLGVPDTGDGRPLLASPKEVADYFRAMAAMPPGSCVAKAKVGTKFRPVDAFFNQQGGIVNSVPGAGEFLDNRNVDSTLAYLINDPDRTFGNRTFAAVFGSTTAALNQPKQNYPFLRAVRPDHPDPWMELRLTWPLSVAGAADLGSMNMADMAGPTGGDWVNPMCHSASVAHPNDPAQARVKEVTVMVVAPGTDDQYCDLTALFNGTEQNSFPPLSGTGPTVVGFTKAYLFDFNILNVEREFAATGGTPVFVGSSPAEDIIDRNPYTTRDRAGVEIQFRTVHLNAHLVAAYRAAKVAWNRCVAIGATPIQIDAYCAVNPADDTVHSTCCECLTDPANDGNPWAACSQICPHLPEAIGCGPEPRNPLSVIGTINNLVDHLAPEVRQCYQDRGCDSPDKTFTEKKACRQGCRRDFGNPNGGNNQNQSVDPLEEPVSADSRWWEEDCFRPLNGNSSGLEDTLGSVHPLLIQDPLDPYYVDRKHFFADPARYYAELYLIALVADLTKPVPDDPDFLAHFPSFEELMDSPDPELALEKGLSTLTARLQEPLESGSDAILVEGWPRRFVGWMRQLASPRAYSRPDSKLFGSDRPGAISEFALSLIRFLGPDPQVFSVAESQIVPTIEGYPAASRDEFLSLDHFDHVAVDDVLDELYRPLMYLQRHTGLSIPGRHCLPMKKDNQFPVRDPNKWEQPRDRKAQFGCGALRLRLSCDAEQTLLSDHRLTERRPMLAK